MKQRNKGKNDFKASQPKSSARLSTKAIVISCSCTILAIKVMLALPTTPIAHVRKEVTNDDHYQ